MTTTFEIRRINHATMDSVRKTGLDVSGNPVEHVVATGGEPLRCCLRDAKPGEQLILFGYEPHLPVSPYREIGAVFAHAGACSGPDFATGYPPEWLGRRQILRAYDRRGWIHPSSRYHDGTDPEAAITAVLADPDVVQVHSRNSVYGCYMFTVVRSAG
jgi:Protein of unknown function (DUF1203)